jgi:hypothetical protein
MDTGICFDTAGRAESRNKAYELKLAEPRPYADPEAARASWRGEGVTMMRTGMTAFTIMALLGFCIQASAQALCPELTGLRSEAQEAQKQSRTVPASERCYMYNRLSKAWGAVAHYANDNREPCRISAASLNEFEQYHREAVRDRDNVCAGRPLRPFPPEVIQR